MFLFLAVKSVLPSLKEAYNKNLMVTLPKLFNKSMRCKELKRISEVTIVTQLKEYCVQCIMPGAKLTDGKVYFYSENTNNKDEAIQTMNELLEILNAIDACCS